MQLHGFFFTYHTFNTFSFKGLPYFVTNFRLYKLDNHHSVSLDTKTYILLKSDRENGIKQLFECYSKKLLTYAIYKWQLEEDVAWDLIYKSIYKTADVIDNYEFETEQKFISFLFKIFLNTIRDHLRNSKLKNNTTILIELNDTIINNHPSDTVDPGPASTAMKILLNELDLLEDWQRILVLMRSQEIPYSEIAKYVSKPEDQLKTYYARLKKLLMEKMNAQLMLFNKKENV